MQQRVGLSLRVVGALMVREMVTRYSRMAGGYLWAILEPVGAIALLALVFSQAFRAPPLGTSFALFYATGYLPMMMFSDLAAKTAEALSFNRQLLNYPNVSLPDALAARFLLNLLTHLLVITLFFGGLFALSDQRPAVEMTPLLLGLGVVAALGFGIGAANCFLTAVTPIWGPIWGVLMRPLFIISCIFFTFESVPQMWRDVLWYNPVIHGVGLVRAGIYPTYDARYAEPGYVLALALITAAAGLFLLRKHRSWILHA